MVSLFLFPYTVIQTLFFYYFLSLSLSSTAFNTLFQLEFLQQRDKLVYFAIAENISSLLIDPQSSTMSEQSFLDLSIIDNLEALIGVDGRLSEKEGLAVLVLVILRDWSIYPGKIRFNTLERLLGSIVRFLKENHPFLRDMITLDLIHLYQLTLILSDKGLIEGITSSILAFQTVEAYISQEIIVAITRRKRPAQRVGFDAGGSSQRSNEGNERNPLEMNPDELLEAVMNTEATEANALLRGMVASATAGGNTANTTNNPATGSSTSTNDSGGALDAGYSAYEKVCNITKKVK